ncbi:MAG TPA: M48 family metalloprotease [Roseimicrobium sp.]|nr:M48 family metalloprotease [Roseimicrobium sp.]
MLLFSSILHFTAACLIALVANELGLRGWRKSAGAHWTERARLLWPARVTAAQSVVLLPFILNFAHQIALPYSEHSFIADGIAAFLGAVLGNQWFDREVYPELDFRKWCHQVLVLCGFRFGLVAMLIAGIALMPSEPGLKMAAVALGFVGLVLAINLGLLLRLLRWIRFVYPAEIRLTGIVEQVASRMHVRVRSTWQMKGTWSNAFALPATGELVFSERLLAVCTDQEVGAICSHELAHLTESKMVLAGRLVGAMSFLPLIFITPSLTQLGILGLLLPIAGMAAVAWFSRWLSQRMEKRADSIAKADQTDDGVYAMALERLYRENQVPAVNINNRQTHPHLYDRMIAAGVTPGYPRPKKPGRMTWAGYGYAVSFAILIVWMIATGH